MPSGERAAGPQFHCRSTNLGENADNAGLHLRAAALPKSLVFYDRFYGLSLFIVFSDEWPNDSNHASSLGTKLPLVRGSTWISTKFDMKIGKSRHSINRMPSHAAAAEAAPCLTLWFTLYISRAAELPAAAEGFHVKKSGGIQQKPWINQRQKGINNIL